jgi:hypothetical protein
MARPRRQHNTTILPDGTVLATGGSSYAGIDTESGKNLYAELWDPATGRWRLLAPQQVYRGYHSSALLLPDGRVLSGGGNGHPDSEVFSPPYLFRGPRPAIASAPDTLSYSSPFTIATPDAANIAKVSVTSLGSSTHAQNWGQHYYPLNFTSTDGALTVSPPPSANLCPPGYKLLWIIDRAGIPSVAKIVRLGGNSTPPPPPANTNAFQQDPGVQGIVSINVEDNAGRIDRGGSSWTPTTMAGSAGTTVLQALPNRGRNINAAIESRARRLICSSSSKRPERIISGCAESGRQPTTTPVMQVWMAWSRQARQP